MGHDPDSHVSGHEGIARWFGFFKKVKNEMWHCKAFNVHD